VTLDSGPAIGTRY